jgi:hypothetical protein
MPIFAIVRAGFGIAETGSVLLSDKELSVNALADLAGIVKVMRYSFALASAVPAFPRTMQ